ncbi:MAG: hypothetical protein AMJ60_08565 [Desulfobacterales bacterium SG8_35]|nr:MAG: hypothetical protein AMJ60_08565 [Desulfobacterales bacterium SG8_35]
MNPALLYLYGLNTFPRMKIEHIFPGRPVLYCTLAEAHKLGVISTVKAKRQAISGTPKIFRRTPGNALQPRQKLC